LLFFSYLLIFSIVSNNFIFFKTERRSTQWLWTAGFVVILAGMSIRRYLFGFRGIVCVLGLLGGDSRFLRGNFLAWSGEGIWFDWSEIFVKKTWV